MLKQTTFIRRDTGKVKKIVTQTRRRVVVVRAVFQLLFSAENAGHWFGGKFLAYPNVATSKTRI